MASFWYPSVRSSIDLVTLASGFTSTAERIYARKTERMTMILRMTMPIHSSSPIVAEISLREIVASMVPWV